MNVVLFFVGLFVMLIGVMMAIMTGGVAGFVIGGTFLLFGFAVQLLAFRLAWREQKSVEKAFDRSLRDIERLL